MDFEQLWYDLKFELLEKHYPNGDLTSKKVLAIMRELESEMKR